MQDHSSFARSWMGLTVDQRVISKVYQSHRVVRKMLHCEGEQNDLTRMTLSYITEHTNITFRK